MDFFFSPVFIKYEIAFLGLNAAYIVFHIFHSLVISYLKMRAFIGKKKTVEEIIAAQSVPLSPDEEKAMETPEETVPEEEKVILSWDDKQHLSELIKSVKTRIARGEFQEARARIIEGLSIEKFNKDLNCLLASLYEKDRDYKKAELIYKDLILLNETDSELYLKLGFALSIQGKYEIAYEIYKRLFSLEDSNIETVDMLANLGHQLGQHQESNEYAQIFLKKNPHNTEILYLTAVNFINLWERGHALESLKKIRTIDPYNSKILELIGKIELEMEMENNFQKE